MHPMKGFGMNFRGKSDRGRKTSSLNIGPGGGWMRDAGTGYGIFYGDSDSDWH